MSELHRMTVSRDVCRGRPSIRGLRIRVTDVLDLLVGRGGVAQADKQTFSA